MLHRLFSRFLDRHRGWRSVKTLDDGFFYARLVQTSEKCVAYFDLASQTLFPCVHGNFIRSAHFSLYDIYSSLNKSYKLFNESVPFSPNDYIRPNSVLEDSSNKSYYRVMPSLLALCRLLSKHVATAWTQSTETRSDPQSHRTILVLPSSYNHIINILPKVAACAANPSNFDQGKLVRRAGARETYVVLNATKHLIPSAATFSRFADDWTKIRVISLTELEEIPTGAPIPE